MKNNKEIIGELREKVKELEEKNRIFALEGSRVKLELYIKENYIPKQAVIDKIEEIIRETAPTPVFKPKSMWNNIDYERLYKTQPLLELLEGGRK